MGAPSPCLVLFFVLAAIAAVSGAVAFVPPLLPITDLHSQTANGIGSTGRPTRFTRKYKRTRRCLFDLRKRGTKGKAVPGSKSHRASSGVRVAWPKMDAAKLGSGESSLPYRVDLALADSGRPCPSRRLLVRYLDTDDLDDAVEMCVNEFGSQTPTPEAACLPGQLVEQPRSPLDELKDRFEDWTLSLTVRIGLTQRIARRKDTSATEPDHHVICLVKEEVEGGEERIVGIVELSQQIPDPEQTAPPYVVPLPIKKLIGKIGTQNRAAVPMLGVEPIPYVSNVLVRPDTRGRGYSRILMAAAEGLARVWYRQRRKGVVEDKGAIVCLHVDADSNSGRAAQGLYKSLGYEGVPDDGTGINGFGKFSWLGEDMLSTGLYIVDDFPLLFMKKELE